MENKTVSLHTTFLSRQNSLRRRPDLGKGTAVTQVRVKDGLACEIEEGPWRLTADLSPKSGGAGAGPTPGTLGRAALGSCLAITYLNWAAYLRLPIDLLEVEVQADYDARGMYDFTDAPADYSEIRYIVRIASPAPKEDVIQLLDLADRHTTFLQVFRNPQPIRRMVEFVRNF